MRFWRVLTRAKGDVPPDSKGLRVYRLCSVGSARVGMHTHLTEIGPKARLEEGACGRRQWAATTPQRADTGCHRRRDLRRVGGSLHPCGDVNGGRPFGRATGRCRHDAVGRAIGFLLEVVAGRVERELWLEEDGAALAGFEKR